MKRYTLYVFMFRQMLGKKNDKKERPACLQNRDTTHSESLPESLESFDNKGGANQS